MATRADVVIVCVGVEVIRVLLEEAMVEGNLEACRGRASVFKGESAGVERRRTLTIGADG